MLRRSHLLLAAITATLGTTSCFELPRSEEEGLEDNCLTSTPTWTAGTKLFAERLPEDIGLKGVTGTRLSAVDVDGDGDADLVVRRNGVGGNVTLPIDDPARTAWVMVNDGTGHFTDATATSNLFGARGTDATSRSGETVAFGDVDGDGVLDAFSGVDTTNETQAQNETSEIVLGSGDGVFALGAASNDVRRDINAGEYDLPASASFVDVDRDGHLDLWVTEHNYDGLVFIGNRLYRGDGSGGFVDESTARGLISASGTTSTSSTLAMRTRAAGRASPATSTTTGTPSC